MIRRSLHLGVGAGSRFRYGTTLSPLQSPVLDAKELARVAAGIGFSAATLTGVEATTVRTRELLSQAASGLRDGDTFLLTFSGHGLAAIDIFGFQQSWCLYDKPLVRFGPKGLDALLATFRAGVRIVIVANCCHATAGDHAPRPTPAIAANVVRIGAVGFGEMAFESGDAEIVSPFVRRVIDAIEAHGFEPFVAASTAALPAAPPARPAP